MFSLARLTHQTFTDPTSGFRAFDRPAIELLARVYPVEYLADTVEVLTSLCPPVHRGVGVTAVRDTGTEVRVRTAGARGSGGTESTHGLGLYIVRRVMDMHGDSAELLRTGPLGTVMRLTLPQAD